MNHRLIALLFTLCGVPLLTTLQARESSVAAKAAPNALFEALRLTIDLKGPTKPFGPQFSGLMTEEINHSYDGGLYGELIRNRAFRDNETNAEAWSLSVPSNVVATMAVTDKFELTDKLPKSLDVVIDKISKNQSVSVSNEGFYGIPVKPDTEYKVSFYAKGNNAWEKKKKEDPDPVTFREPLSVSLQSNDGSKVYASAKTAPLTGNWQKFELTLKTGSEITPSKENKFVISASAPGAFRLSLVSLFPPTYKNRPNGNRIDLMEKMAGLHPQFLRFPGGNFVEGDNLCDRYDWKETRGPLEFRPGHAGCWKYRSSDGLGLLEFMEWCEDLGMQPVLAVYAGYSLRQQPVLAGPLLQPYVQDALDEIEYLTGDAKTTHWGAIRAKDGHPEPFRLKYIEVGNEDTFDRGKSYDARYAQFHDAIKSKYPDLQLIATIPVTSRKPDVVDDHYYPAPEWFVKEFHHYDKTDRNGPKIFVGEWASRVKHVSAQTPNLGEALGDAAWMCAMERNADLIIMQCYAPLLVNVSAGASQWSPNLIGYDALNSFVSPSWHAQQLFNTHRGDEVLTATTDKEDPANLLPYSVTRDKEKGLIHIKLVNIAPTTRKVTIDLGKETKVNPNAEVVILGDKDPKALNTIEKPEAVKPVTKTISDASSDFSITLEPSSLTIVTLKTR
jgi:alpha-N-arabinofuranosidase